MEERGREEGEETEGEEETEDIFVLVRDGRKKEGEGGCVIKKQEKLVLVKEREEVC